MGHDQEFFVDVEQGFSRYIQSCLFHISWGFFREIDRDFLRIFF